MKMFTLAICYFPLKGTIFYEKSYSDLWFVIFSKKDIFSLKKCYSNNLLLFPTGTQVLFFYLCFSHTGTALFWDRPTVTWPTTMDWWKWNTTMEPCTTVSPPPPDAPRSPWSVTVRRGGATLCLWTRGWPLRGPTRSRGTRSMPVPVAL